MTQARTARSAFEWIAGRPCLDFVNTVAWPETDAEDERLRDYGDLLAWGIEAGLLPAGRRGELERAAAGDRRAAQRALARARGVRRVIHDLFAGPASGRAVDRATLAAFNAQLGPALAASWIGPAKEGFTRQWSAGPGDLDQIVRPVLADAADLVLGEQWRHVRACADDTCGWLFLDTSHNRLRRWCDMRVCGNRAKARRHYQRVRATRRRSQRPAA
jgi:predicted RNA-binding Zn ribbon-like protein